MFKTSGARILIVDDRPVRAGIEQVLHREGHVTDHAASAQEALAIVATGCVDLVVVDVMLPGMDGPSSLERSATSSTSGRCPSSP